jgi:hypothetical protein
VAVRKRGAWRTGPAAISSGRFLDVSVGFGPGGALTVHAVTRDAMFVSPDGGGSWRPLRPAGSFTAVAASPRDPQTVYVSYRRLEEPSGLSTALGRERTFFEVAVSTDGGDTWSYPWKERGTKAPNVDDGWQSERFRPAGARIP